MTAEQQGVSPATAGGASTPNPATVDNSIAYALTHHYGFLPLNVRYAAAAAARAVTESWTRSRPVPEAEILPADGTPDPRDAEIERLRVQFDGIRGALRAANILIEGARSERDQLRAELDRLHASNYADEQLRFDAYAELLNVLDEGWHPPVGTGTFRAVRAAIVKALDLRAQYKTERDEARVERDRLRARLDQHLADENSAQAVNDRLRNELTRERAIYADSPDDRVYHAADNTWWRRAADGRLVRADTPAIRLVSEPDAE